MPKSRPIPNGTLGRLLPASAIALACLLAIFFLIRYVDTPVAHGVMENLGGMRNYFRMIAIAAGVPAVVLLLLCAVGSMMFRHLVPSAIGAISRLSAIGAVAAFAVNDYGLKPVFGRADMQTWKMGGGNGFHFFHGSLGYSSFPSGHMAIAGAVLTVIAILQPAWRWACIAVGCLVAVALIGAQWHFASDIFGGLLVGATVAALVVAMNGALRQRRHPPIEEIPADNAAV